MRPFSFARALIILFLSALLAGCASAAEPTPVPSPTRTPLPQTGTGWVTAVLREPIDALPSWQGLTPGLTSQAEILAWAESRYALTDNSPPFDGGYLTSYSFSYPPYSLVFLDMQDDVLQTITFDVGGLYISDFLSAFGEPTWVIIHDLPLPPDRVAVNLFYASLGLRVQAVAYFDEILVAVDEANVYPEMDVLLFSLHPPVDSNNFQDIYERWVWYDSYNTRKHANQAVPWTGYGNYAIELVPGPPLPEGMYPKP